MGPTPGILGLGVVAVDDILHVGRYPPPDAKEPVQRRERQCGGLTATSLVAAARLGSRCSYAGILGREELSLFVERRFQEEGIDLSLAVRQDGAAPVHSTIIVDTGRKTRNIFFFIGGISGAHAELPSAETIRSARILLVDHFGMDGMIRAARIAREAGVPVVADLERDNVPRFGELLALVDHLVLSRDFAGRLTGKDDPAEAALALWAGDRDTVIVTAGAEGSWRIHRDDPLRAVHQTAFPVEAVDTTGCGDVFHGAYASALDRGLAVAERVRFASAAAALKALRPGGQAGIPDRAAVERFLQERAR